MKLKHDKLKNMTTLCMMSDTIVVTAHNDGTMAIWDTTRDDPLLRSWSAHGVEPYYKTASITTLLKINNKTVASGGYDCLIKLWDIEREECVKHLQDSGYITGLQIKAEGQLVSSSVYNSNRSNTVRVWDYHSGNCIATFVPDGKILGVNAGQHWRYPTNTIVLPDQRIAFTTYNEALGGRAIVIWDSVKQSHECYPVKHQSRIDGLTAIPESDDFFTLASISSDMTLMQWPLSPFEMNTNKVNHSGVLRAFNDGTIVCLGSDQVSIYSAIGKLLTNFNVKSAYFPFPDNVKDCHDIWIKLADDCLFKVNLKELLTFTAEQGRNIHHYLLTRNDYRVLQAYYSCVTNKINLNEIINAAGDTILHMAARGRNWRYTKLLLDYSDEKDISKAGLTENKAGETPYSIASSYPPMKNIFLRYPVIQNIENKKALAELVKQISQLTSECNNLLEQNNKIKTEMGRLEMALRDAQLAEKAEKDARLKEEIDLNQLRSEMVSLKGAAKKDGIRAAKTSTIIQRVRY